MGYQECLVVPHSKADFKMMLDAYRRVKSKGLYDDFTCNAQPLSIICLKQPIAGIGLGIPIMWTCGERFASNINGVFGKELPWHCRLKFIPIENVIQAKSGLIEGIDFNSKKTSENQYLTRYDMKSYIDMLVKRNEKER